MILEAQSVLVADYWEGVILVLKIWKTKMLWNQKIVSGQP